MIEFWNKVDKSATNGCWLWTGTVNDGYGYYRGQRAHCIAYEAVLGSVPAGRELDHLCRNRRCVHPRHLEPVTRRVNAIRGANARYGRDPLEDLSILINMSGSDRRLTAPQDDGLISTKLLVSALRAATATGISTPDLIKLCGRSRSWVYGKLAEVGAHQVRHGRWTS